MTSVLRHPFTKVARPRRGRMRMGGERVRARWAGSVGFLRFFFRIPCTCGFGETALPSDLRTCDLEGCFTCVRNPQVSDHFRDVTKMVRWC